MCLLPCAAIFCRVAKFNAGSAGESSGITLPGIPGIGSRADNSAVY
jgi:hypothetical protein